MKDARDLRIVAENDNSVIICSICTLRYLLFMWNTMDDVRPSVYAVFSCCECEWGLGLSRLTKHQIMLFWCSRCICEQIFQSDKACKSCWYEHIQIITWIHLVLKNGFKHGWANNDRTFILSHTFPTATSRLQQSLLILVQYSILFSLFLLCAFSEMFLLAFWLSIFFLSFFLLSSFSLPHLRRRESGVS